MNIYGIVIIDIRGNTGVIEVIQAVEVVGSDGDLESCKVRSIMQDDRVFASDVSIHGVNNSGADPLVIGIAVGFSDTSNTDAAILESLTTYEAAMLISVSIESDVDAAFHRQFDLDHSLVISSVRLISHDVLPPPIILHRSFVRVHLRKLLIGHVSAALVFTIQMIIEIIVVVLSVRLTIESQSSEDASSVRVPGLSHLDYDVFTVWAAPSSRQLLRVLIVVEFPVVSSVVFPPEIAVPRVDIDEMPVIFGFLSSMQRVDVLAGKEFACHNRHVKVFIVIIPLTCILTKFSQLILKFILDDVSQSIIHIYASNGQLVSVEHNQFS